MITVYVQRAYVLFCCWHICIFFTAQIKRPIIIQNMIFKRENFLAGDSFHSKFSSQAPNILIKKIFPNSKPYQLKLWKYFLRWVTNSTHLQMTLSSFCLEWGCFLGITSRITGKIIDTGCEREVLWMMSKGHFSGWYFASKTLWFVNFSSDRCEY